MSVPPERPSWASRTPKQKGVIAAVAVVVLVPSVIGIALGLSGSADPVSSGLFFGPLVAWACVVLGSILTIFQRTRLFAVGFLLTSAILILVTAGACVIFPAASPSNA